MQEICQNIASIDICLFALNLVGYHIKFISDLILEPLKIFNLSNDYEV